MAAASHKAINFIRLRNNRLRNNFQSHKAAAVAIFSHSRRESHASTAFSLKASFVLPRGRAKGGHRGTAKEYNAIMLFPRESSGIASFR
ncbi:hypothetical protein WN55_03113 [Dufourea novaeangliae]|uniref:Uncharacterized protein n=1 Tax=Dufourea novaeangliae TaxID=178035 RepID=A0A154PJN2_DUFNO|nr:hypothetical protein WN55_03113 [Dufourea novaeangliae]